MSTPEHDSDQLTCGREADDILSQVADGRGEQRDAHQQQCPHCQAALAEYARLWAPMHALAAEQVRAPESIIDTALARIRGAVVQTDYGILDSEDGLTRIAARVVVVTARESAQHVPGVRVALSKDVSAGLGDHRGAMAPGAGVTAGVAGRSTAIEITLAADYGQNLPDLAERVRAQVAHRVRTLTDLDPVQITVIIDDVLG